LEWLSRESCAAAFAQELAFPSGDINSLRLAPARRLRLDFFQAIHMRKDPPYDMNYIASTWLLDSAVARGVKVYNAPHALRNLNEKLSIFQYPEAIRDLVSADPQQLLEFIKESANGDAVLKPLTLYGGRGVLRLNLNQQKEEKVLHILREETQNGQDLRLIQAFDERIFQGELRAFCVNGKALSWCLKKPISRARMRWRWWKRWLRPWSRKVCISWVLTSLAASFRKSISRARAFCMDRKIRTITTRTSRLRWFMTWNEWEILPSYIHV
jgi:glutathione synthetase